MVKHESFVYEGGRLGGERLGMTDNEITIAVASSPGTKTKSRTNLFFGGQALLRRPTQI